jgi:hypothetical protein
MYAPLRHVAAILYGWIGIRDLPMVFLSEDTCMAPTIAKCVSLLPLIMPDGQDIDPIVKADLENLKYCCSAFNKQYDPYDEETIVDVVNVNGDVKDKDVNDDEEEDEEEEEKRADDLDEYTLGTILQLWIFSNPHIQNGEDIRKLFDIRHFPKATDKDVCAFQYALGQMVECDDLICDKAFYNDSNDTDGIPLIQMRFVAAILYGWIGNLSIETISKSCMASTITHCISLLPITPDMDPLLKTNIEKAQDIRAVLGLFLERSRCLNLAYGLSADA